MRAPHNRPFKNCISSFRIRLETRKVSPSDHGSTHDRDSRGMIAIASLLPSSGINLRNQFARQKKKREGEGRGRAESLWRAQGGKTSRSILAATRLARSKQDKTRNPRLRLASARKGILPFLPLSLSLSLGSRELQHLCGELTFMRARRIPEDSLFVAPRCSQRVASRRASTGAETATTEILPFSASASRHGSALSWCIT